MTDANEDEQASQRTRQTAFLKALLDHSGNVSRAASAAGISVATVTLWRQDRAFADAVKALRVVAGRPSQGGRRNYRHATEQGFELFLEYRGQGLSQERAAEQAGISVGSVYYRAANDEAFAQRLEAIKPVVRRGRRPAEMAITEKRLRELWADGSLTLAVIADAASLTVSQLRSRAERMRLPQRRATR